jgi:hypothetical protein
VGAIVVVFAARSRRYWRSWLALAALVALGAGLVLAAAAAGRRADSAFPRFVAAHGYDAIVYTSRPLPLATLPEVTQVVAITAPFHAAPWCSCGKTINDGDFAVRQVAPADLTRMVKLVSGRLPDQSSPREAVASFTMQRDYGIGPGTLIRFRLPGPDQRDAIMAALANDGRPPGQPDGPVVTLTVTGIVAAESEFPFGQGASYDLYPTGAFARATAGTPALPFYYVRLRHGAADLAQFDSTVSGQYQAGVEDLDRPAAAITASVQPQAIGWWVLAGLAALAAIGVVGQALARQAAAESADDPVLAALGLRARQLVALGMLRTLALAAAGGGGVALAYALSPLAPAGEARLADPTPGLALDGPVTASGAAGALALVLVPPRHAGGAGELRGVGELPVAAGDRRGAVRRRDPAAPAGRQRRPSPGRQRPAEGARLHPPPAGRRGVLAVGDRRRRRHRRGRPAGHRRRPRALARLRHLRRRDPRSGAARLADRGPGGWRGRRRPGDRDRPRAAGRAAPPGQSPARRVARRAPPEPVICTSVPRAAPPT